MVKRDFEGDLWPATRKRRWQRFASARTGRPLGGDEFVHSLEQATRRSLAPQKGGRSGNSLPLQTQTRLVFEK